MSYLTILRRFDKVLLIELRLRDKDLKRLHVIIVLCLSFSLTFLALFNVYVFLFLIVIPFILLREEGIEIDLKNSKIRRYKQFFYHKKGNWIDLKQFANMVILKKRGIKKTIGTRMTGELRSTLIYYELFIVKEDHRRRVLIQTTKSKRELFDLAKLISVNTGIELVDYKI